MALLGAGTATGRSVRGGPREADTLSGARGRECRPGWGLPRWSELSAAGAPGGRCGTEAQSGDVLV